MPTTPQVQITGTIYDLNGNPNAGQVVVTLCNYGSTPPTVTRSVMLAPTQIVAQAAADGTFSVTIYGNYQLSPSGTYYAISIVPNGFNAPLLNAAYQFLSAGSFDLSTLTTHIATAAGTVTVAPTFVAGTMTVTSAIALNATITTPVWPETMFLATGGVSGITLTLPDPSASQNRKIIVKKIDSGNGSVAVVPHASESIEGDVSYTLVNQNQRVGLISDGSNWYVYSNN